MVVEIVSGMSALALALVLGPRIGFKKDAMRPHNLPFVLLGVGLLWFGWFGCLGMMGWLAVEQIRDGRPTTFGAASAVVAGLVATTPSCGTVNILGAAVVGQARASSVPSRLGRNSGSATTIRWTWSACTSSVGSSVCC